MSLPANSEFLCLERIARHRLAYGNGSPFATHKPIDIKPRRRCPSPHVYLGILPIPSLQQTMIFKQGLFLMGAEIRARRTEAVSTCSVLLSALISEEHHRAARHVGAPYRITGARSIKVRQHPRASSLSSSVATATELPGTVHTRTPCQSSRVLRTHPRAARGLFAARGR
ncbi:cAMP-specific 3',5'-cyclic phosphodiesterase 4D isoform X6 [Arapaima gigas]